MARQIKTVLSNGPVRLFSIPRPVDGGADVNRDGQTGRIAILSDRTPERRRGAWVGAAVSHAFIAGGIIGVVIIALVGLGIVTQLLVGESPQGVIIAGKVLILVGFFIPWYWVVFSPPHGSALVNGAIMKASTFTESGLVERSSDGGKILIGAIAAGAVLAVVGLTSAGHVARFLHAGTHLILAYAVLAFVWLQLAFWNTGFRADFVNQAGRTQSAIAASRYVSGHLGVGLVILTVGMIFTGAALIKQILIWLGLFILVVIALAIFDKSALSSFFHWLDFSSATF
jgi:MFS family permease